MPSEYTSALAVSGLRKKITNSTPDKQAVTSHEMQTHDTAPEPETPLSRQTDGWCNTDHQLKQDGETSLKLHD